MNSIRDNKQQLFDQAKTTIAFIKNSGNRFGLRAVMQNNNARGAPAVCMTKTSKRSAVFRQVRREATPPPIGRRLRNACMVTAWPQSGMSNGTYRSSPAESRGQDAAEHFLNFLDFSGRNQNFVLWFRQVNGRICTRNPCSVRRC